MKASNQRGKGRVMREEFKPAIEALQKDLVELERKVIETKTTINKLCSVADAPPMYPDVGSPSQPTVGSIRADTFYGKSVQTAAREYLEMRRGANLGPCTTREIYDALVQGGFHFETSDPNNAMTGIRAVMRKNSATFHRLPNNSWGLTSWYERIKKAKAAKDDAEDSIDDDASDENVDEETAVDIKPTAA